MVMEKDWSLDEVQYFLSAQMFPISDDREADAMPFYGEEPEGKPRAWFLSHALSAAFSFQHRCVCVKQFCLHPLG